MKNKNINDQDKQRAKEFQTVGEYSRKQYFQDYYLKKVIVISVAVLAVISLFLRIFGKDSEIVLYVAILNEMKWLDTEPLLSDIQEEFQLDLDKQEIIISVYNLEENSDLSKLYTLMANEQVDVLISNQQVLEYYQQYDYLLDLDTLSISQSLVLEPLLISNQENMKYAIEIPEQSKYHQLGGSIKNPVLSVVGNSNRMDTVHEFIECLMK